MDQAQYELLARKQSVHWWYRARREILGAVLERYLPGSVKRNIIEIGAGAGGNIATLQEFGRVTAVELDDASRAILREQFPDLDVRGGALPDQELFAETSYDAAVLFDVLEHVAEEDASLKIIREHVKPGGLLFLSVPAYRWLWGQHDERVHHQRRYSRGYLRGVLAKAGWQVEQLGHMNTFLFPLAVLARMKDKIFRGGATTGSGVPVEPVNSIFYNIFRQEKSRVVRGGYPFGLSVVAVARNPLLGTENETGGQT